MLIAVSKLDFARYGRLVFVIGHSDTWSMTKIKDFFRKNRQIDVDKVDNLEFVRLFRSREVKQSYVTSVFTTLLGLAHSLWLVIKIRPDIVNIS